MLDRPLQAVQEFGPPLADAVAQALAPLDRLAGAEVQEALDLLEQAQHNLAALLGSTPRTGVGPVSVARHSGPDAALAG